MRLTRYHLFLLGGLFLMVMGPLAFTQPGPGGRGKGGKGGPPSDFMFTMMSGGNDSFEVSKVQLRERPGSTVEQQREQMLTFLVKKGINNGVMTKAVFPEYWEERMTEMRAKWADKSKLGGGLPLPPGAAPPVPGAPAPDPEALARESFVRMDTDKNGSLSVQEIQATGRRGQRFLDDLAKWDTNKNGAIELPEYIEYFKDRMAQRGNRGNPAAPVPVPEPVKPIEEDKRPTVYRTGKLPKELPSWFEAADKDKDGQVGLYEWKESGKPIDEFMTMDLNGDGFLTVEEVLRYQRVTTKGTASSSTPTPSAAPNPAVAFPNQGGRQRGRGNIGGGNNGGGRMRGGRSKGG